MRLLQCVHCLLMCRLVVGLTLSQHVDGWLARHHGQVGGLHGHGVVWAAVALVSAPAPPAGVRSGLVGGLLGHFQVRGRWGHWAVKLEMPGCLAMMAGRGFGTRIGVRGPCGDVVAAVGAPVLPDPAEALGLAVWSGSTSVLVWCVRTLALVQGVDLVDAHGLTQRPHRGHGHLPWPHDAGC